MGKRGRDAYGEWSCEEKAIGIVEIKFIAVKIIFVYRKVLSP